MKYVGTSKIFVLLSQNFGEPRHGLGIEEFSNIYLIVNSKYNMQIHLTQIVLGTLTFFFFV